MHCHLATAAQIEDLSISNMNDRLDSITITRQLYVNKFNNPELINQALSTELKLDNPYQLNASVMFDEDSFKLEVPPWGQALLSDYINYQVGMVASRALYNSSSKGDYVNQSFSAAAASPLPTKGFGAYGTVQRGERLAITAGIHEDVIHRWDSDSVDTSAYFSALGIDYQPAWSEDGSERYKFTLWRRDSSADTRASSGFSVDLEKDYRKAVSWSPFLRFSYQQTDALKVSKLASAGVNIGALPWNRDTRLGIAYAHKQSNTRDQAAHTVEMYFRMLLTPYLEITPDVQLIYQPEDFPGLEQITISRLNFRLLF